jgi:threonine dehydratase
MTNLLPSRAELERAAQVVYENVSPTPQYAWRLLARRLRAEVRVKHENDPPPGEAAE